VVVKHGTSSYGKNGAHASLWSTFLWDTKYKIFKQNINKGLEPYAKYQHRGVDLTIEHAWQVMNVARSYNVSYRFKLPRGLATPSKGLLHQKY
jgi:hypothetical protein